MFSCFQSTLPQDSELYIEIKPFDHVQTSSNLTVLCYGDNTKKVIVPCDFRWTRIIDGSALELGEVKGNSYMCQPDDLGSIIQVDISSRDSPNPKRAVITFGPVQMDLTLKPNVQNIIVSDMFKQFIKISDYGETKQCCLSISSKFIQISDLQGNTLLQLDYFVDSPVIRLNPRQANKVSIVFVLPSNQPLKTFYDTLFKRPTAFGGCSIDLCFVNRISRDMFVFALKIFSSKKDLKVAELLMAIQQRNRLKTLLNIDSLLVVQYLRRDLKRYIKMYNQEKQHKQVCLLEVGRLQEQIANMRLNYTKYIKQCLKQLHPNTEESIIQGLDERNFEFNYEVENKHLKFRVIKLNEQVEVMKTTQVSRVNRKIFGTNMSSPVRMGRSTSDSDQVGELLHRIELLEGENIQIGRKFSQLLEDYSNVKFQKQQLQKDKLNSSFRSTQSQQAITTINKLIGDIVQLKRSNAQLALCNQKLTGKKALRIESNPDTVEILDTKLKETQRLLEVSQQSYQRMKEMFEKTQVKYSSPKSSSYSSSSEKSTARQNQLKSSPPKQKSAKTNPKLSVFQTN